MSRNENYLLRNPVTIAATAKRCSPARTWALSRESCTDSRVSPTFDANDSGQMAFGDVEPSTHDDASPEWDDDDQMPPLAPPLPRMSRIRLDSLRRCRRLAKLATDICLKPARRDLGAASSSAAVVEFDDDDEFFDFLGASAAAPFDIDFTLVMSVADPDDVMLFLHL